MLTSTVMFTSDFTASWAVLLTTLLFWIICLVFSKKTTSTPMRSILGALGKIILLIGAVCLVLAIIRNNGSYQKRLAEEKMIAAQEQSRIEQELKKSNPLYTNDILRAQYEAATNAIEKEFAERQRNKTNRVATSEPTNSVPPKAEPPVPDAGVISRMNKLAEAMSLITKAQADGDWDNTQKHLAVESFLHSTSNRVEQIREQLTKRIDGLESKVDDINTNHHGLAKRLQMTETNVARIDEQVQKHDYHINEVRSFLGSQPIQAARPYLGEGPRMQVHGGADPNRYYGNAVMDENAVRLDAKSDLNDVMEMNQSITNTINGQPVVIESHTRIRSKGSTNNSALRFTDPAPAAPAYTPPPIIPQGKTETVTSNSQTTVKETRAESDAVRVTTHKQESLLNVPVLRDMPGLKNIPTSRFDIALDTTYRILNKNLSPAAVKAAGDEIHRKLIHDEKEVLVKHAGQTDHEWRNQYKRKLESFLNAWHNEHPEQSGFVIAANELPSVREVSNDAPPINYSGTSPM